jgi:hypothetical protein
VSSQMVPAGSPAKELTQEEYEALVETCHALQEQVKAGLRKGREAAWQVAQALTLFDEERGWEVLGYETVSEWLADPEIGMGKTTYYRWIQTWKTLAARNVDPSSLGRLDPSKVSIIVPALRSGKASTKDALADVEALAASDLREKYVRPARRLASSTVEDVINAADEDVAFAGTPTYSAALADDPSSIQGPSKPQDEADPSSPLPPTPGSPEIDSEQPHNGAVEVLSPDSDDETGDLDRTPNLSVLGKSSDDDISDADFVRLPLPDALPRLMAAVLKRVLLEVAPKEKKKMSNDLRAEVERVMVLALDAGLVDSLDPEDPEDDPDAV